MNHSSLASLFLSLLIVLGRLKTPSDWQTCRGSCLVCGLQIGALKGLFCANYGWRRSPEIPVCFGAWHAGCYKQLETDRFPVLQTKDLDDSIMDAADLVDEDPRRFKEAREGVF